MVNTTGELEDNNKTNGRRVFLTINRKRNPRSVSMIGRLQNKGCVGYMVTSVEEAKDIVNALGATEVVALFDRNKGVKCWSPCDVLARCVPRWAKKLSSKLCIAIGKKCKSPNAADREARQIVFFSSKFFNGGVNGISPPKPQSRSCRKMMLPKPVYSRLVWRYGK